MIVPVKGYEEEYMISSTGVVFRKNNNELRSLKGIPDKDGYLHVSLCKNNQKKRFSIHRLVAENFIPNIKQLPMVNHKDENKQNNNVDNLEWCTSQYNSTYNNVNFRRAESRKKPVIAFKNGEYLEFGSITEASRILNTNHGNIVMCLQGKRKTVKGYSFLLKG